MEGKNHKYIQEVLPDMSERDILEGMTTDELMEYRNFLLDKYADLEAAIHRANEVLDGYGVEYGD